jgi:uncharacterized damage-inducible protein DinB
MVSEVFEPEYVRRLQIWARRQMRPHAAKHTLAELRQAAEDAQAQFLDAYGSLSGEVLDVRSSPEVMSPRDILAHLTVALGWQAAKIRSIYTGEEVDDSRFELLFQGAGGAGNRELLAGFEAAWSAVAQAVAGMPDACDLSSGHPLFGPLNAREWLAAIAEHFDYHRGQLPARPNPPETGIEAGKSGPAIK